MSHYLDFAEAMLRRRHGLPEDFRFFKFEAVGETGEDYSGTMLTGVICPLVATGPRKGRPNWKAKDKTTQRKFFVPDSAVAQEEQAYESETGKCAECMGSGKQVHSVSAKAGTTYRPCRKCKGSCLAKAEVANAR
jgi:hypothetical protein